MSRETQFRALISSRNLQTKFEIFRLDLEFSSSALKSLVAEAKGTGGVNFAGLTNPGE